MPRAPPPDNVPEPVHAITGKRSRTEDGEEGKTPAATVATATAAGKGHVPRTSGAGSDPAQPKSSEAKPKTKPHARTKGVPHAVKATVEYPSE